MKIKVRAVCTFLTGMLLALTLSGCVGEIFSVEDESVTNIETDMQGSLLLDVLDGNIELKFWQENYIKIAEKRTAKGPAKKEKLEEILNANMYTIEKSDYSVLVKKPEEADKEDSKKGKSVFSFTNDMEIIVPESVYNISIRAGDGNITITGGKQLSNIDLKLNNGNIVIEGMQAGKINTIVERGIISISEIKGNCEFKCNRGVISVSGAEGNITAKLTEGEINVEAARGMLDCDISAGKINITDSRLLKNSMFYASTGEINAELDLADEEGKVKFMAAKGDIRLKMPHDSGWSLIARSTKGRVINRLKPDQELKKSPSGEVYGDVRGGGVLIDAYVDDGNIYLQNG